MSKFDYKIGLEFEKKVKEYWKEHNKDDSELNRNYENAIQEFNEKSSYQLEEVKDYLEHDLEEHTGNSWKMVKRAIFHFDEELKTVAIEYYLVEEIGYAEVNDELATTDGNDISLNETLFEDIVISDDVRYMEASTYFNLEGKQLSEEFKKIKMKSLIRNQEELNKLLKNNQAYLIKTVRFPYILGQNTSEDYQSESKNHFKNSTPETLNPTINKIINDSVIEYINDKNNDEIKYQKNDYTK